MNITPEDLLFSKEAADYLGISVQRLNKLTNDGVIKPFKKGSSGTLYLREELQRREEELAIFKEKEPRYQKGDEGMFLIDTAAKQEAINFSTLMLSMNMTEKKLTPLFDGAAHNVDIASPLLHDIGRWSSFFGIEPSILESNYRFSEHEFRKLQADDEILKLGDMRYPRLLAETEEAPRFLYLRGDSSPECI